MSPIRKFSLVCGGSYNKSHLNAWVKHAIQKGVEEFHYQVNEYKLPDELVMSKTLVKLKVIGYAHHNIKFSVLSSCLPSLKILHLNYVRFDHYQSMEGLLSSCELLEKLTLDDCLLQNTGRHLTISIGLLKVLRIKHCDVKDGFLEIEAPNLAYLTYYSSVGVKIVSLSKNSCSLVKANLYFNGCSNDRLSEDDRNILRAVVYKTTELHLLSDSVQNFRRCCYFPVESPPSECLIPFSSKVKVIEVHDFCGYEALLLLLRYLLRNARVLKKLILRNCHDCDNIEEALQIRNDLLMFPRASSDCCIEFKYCNNFMKIEVEAN